MVSTTVIIIIIVIVFVLVAVGLGVGLYFLLRPKTTGSTGSTGSTGPIGPTGKPTGSTGSTGTTNNTGSTGTTNNTGNTPPPPGSVILDGVVYSPVSTPSRFYLIQQDPGSNVKYAKTRSSGDSGYTTSKSGGTLFGYTPSTNTLTYGGSSTFGYNVVNGVPTYWGTYSNKVFYDGYTFYATDYLYRGQGWVPIFMSDNASIIAQNVGMNYFGKSLPPNAFQVLAG